MANIKQFLEIEFDDPDQLVIDDLFALIRDKKSNLYQLMKKNARKKVVHIEQRKYLTYKISEIVSELQAHPELIEKISETQDIRLTIVPQEFCGEYIIRDEYLEINWS